MKLNLNEVLRGVESELAKKANAPTVPLQFVSSTPASAIPVTGRVVNSLVPAAAKAGGGMLAKSIPYLGTALHGGMAIYDAMQGDWTGAGLNAAGALANLLPIPGASLPFDAIYAARSLKNNVAPAVGNQMQGMMGAAGKIAPYAMGALALAGGRNSAQPQAMPQAYAQPYRPMNFLNTTSMDPHSLAAPQMRYESLADNNMFREKMASYLRKKSSVLDAFANAAARKVVDHVVDSAAPRKDPEEALKEKELEITSKHPEIAAILEDQKNKNYLQKLLNE